MRPPLGYLEPEQAITLRVSLTTKEVPPPFKHFFAIYHMPSEEREKQARNVWAAAPKPEGVRRMPCVFEKEDGTEWRPADVKPRPAADKK